MREIKVSIIDICFSTNAGESLKHAVKKKKLFEGKKIIAFGDDISQGIIGNGINIDEQIDWWNNTDNEEEKIYSAQSDYLKKSYKQC